MRRLVLLLMAALALSSCYSHTRYQLDGKIYRVTLWPTAEGTQYTVLDTETNLTIEKTLERPGRLAQRLMDEGMDVSAPISEQPIDGGGGH